MNRETQSLVMLLVGGAALRISVTDVYLRYVREGLRPFLIVSAGILLLVGAVTLWREMRERTRADRQRGQRGPQGYGTPQVSSHYDGKHRAATDSLSFSQQAGRAVDSKVGPAPHGHGHGGPWVAWLLIVPVLAIFLIAPPALGSFAAERSGTSIAAPVNSDYPPLPGGDPAPLTVLDYATRAVFEGDASLRDRAVKLTGFTSRREGGGVRLTRIILTCCAADGRPVKITMVGELTRNLAADTWVEVVGHYDKRLDIDPANGEKIPYLRVSSLRKVAKPTNPYDG
ncbi:MAG: TIGR03943 family protein [Acidimicrobiales bacterium]|nr:MAG: TIGR03943 family protein [Acidimicrobiales bacterium]